MTFSETLPTKAERFMWGVSEVDRYLSTGNRYEAREMIMLLKASANPVFPNSQPCVLWALGKVDELIDQNNLNCARAMVEMLINHVRYMEMQNKENDC